MERPIPISSSNTNIGAGYNKVFCRSGGSTTSLDPSVSCKTYWESTNISNKNGVSNQTKFPDPPFEDLDFILVGLGEKGKNCGLIYASHICENLNCLKVHYSKQKCLRKACPECYKGWMVEEREKIIARLLSKEGIKKNKGKRLVEITLSPDPKIVPVYLNEFKLLIKEGYKYAKKKGVKGGCAIIHPFRATKEAKILSIRSNEKTWRWIREEENPERYYYYSPHLHILAYVDHLKKPEEGERWIYKTKTNENGNVIDFLRKAKREKTLQKRIDYFLSHTGTLRKEEENFHSVRWFGTCSYNKFETTEEEKEVREEEGKEEKRCKVCGKELMHFWKWVKMSYGDVYRDILNNALDPPKYWDEVQRIIDREDPPGDAEKYLI